jgi:glucokinase
VLTIGVDIGGTKVAAGVVDEQGVVLARTRHRTPSTDPSAVEEVIADAVKELCAAHDVGAIGIGAAGFIDHERGVVLVAPNLAWRDEPLRDAVAERVGLPVVVDNDANAAAWAEYRFGAGQGEQHLMVVTVGTGIGGGIVIGGELYHGRWGIAAEYGHMQVSQSGRRCGCGQHGCWEQYVSGRALLHEAREIADVQPGYGKRLLELGGGRPEGIEAPEVTAAAREGDPAALDCFEEVGTWLGQGLADLAAVLDPGAFVVGGGVADAGELLLAPARRVFEQRLTGTGSRPLAEIRLAALGNDAGLVGAAHLARRA